MAATLDFLERHKHDGEDMLSRIVTEDETWVHYFTPSTKKKSMVWEEPTKLLPKKFKTVLSANEVMCAVFLGCESVIWQEYLLKGTTINEERYCEMLKNLRKVIKRKRLGLLMKRVILLHDNACPNSANITQELLQQFYWDVLRHRTYSPNLAPSNFALFPAQVTLGGKKFSNDEEVATFTQNYFANLGLQFYQSSIQKLVSRYDKCLNLFDNYVEK